METQRLAVAVMHCEKCVANVARHYEELAWRRWRWIWPARAPK